MAVTAHQTAPMTYEDYLAEPEVEGRYDIIDGIRVFITSPTLRHQRILLHLVMQFMQFERSFQAIRVFLAPLDLLINGPSLRVRQPDVFIVSLDRLGIGLDDTPAVPICVPPQVAVEILSPSDTRFALAAKLQDYASIGVDEYWLVSPDAGTVELLSLADGDYKTEEIYGIQDVVQSVVFPELTVTVADIFAS